MEGQGTNLAIKRTGSLSSPGIMYPQGRHPVCTSLCLFYLSVSVSLFMSPIALSLFFSSVCLLSCVFLISFFFF